MIFEMILENFSKFEKKMCWNFSNTSLRERDFQNLKRMRRNEEIGYNLDIIFLNWREKDIERRRIFRTYLRNSKRMRNFKF